MPAKGKQVYTFKIEDAKTIVSVVTRLGAYNLQVRNEKSTFTALSIIIYMVPLYTPY